MGALGSRGEAVLMAALDGLIPSDGCGPGALEAGVPRYVEGALARGGETASARWREGLAQLDELAAAHAGMGFAELGAEARERFLERVADGSEPWAPAVAPFFEELRQRAIEGMFCDPAWGGNADRAGWRLLGYPGPRHVWSAADQRIAELPRAP